MELFSDDFQTSCEADLFRPLREFLRMKKMGQNAPPYIPKFELLPLHKLCHLALLWKEAGFHEEAGRLAAWLLKLESFPSLWCPEKEFDEKKIADSFAHLRGVEGSGPAPDFDLTLVETAELKAALTIEGNGTSLGMIRAGVEIRAFGPQSDYLNFGIKGKGMNGWTRMASYPEVWLEMKHEARGEGLGLDFRFIGVKPEHPVSMAFYVKAGVCQIENERILPKSLRRFQGEAKRVLFDNKCLIECGAPQKIEVIPLAGGGCFWDTEFLIAFPINAFAPQLSLTIAKIVPIPR